MADQPPNAFAGDLLTRRPFAQRLENYLLIEHAFVESALVVSLHAPFGSGKSTFLSMWSADLCLRREKDDRTPRVVVINAWETDHCGDPLVAILAGLTNALTHGPRPSPEEAGKLREVAKDVGWMAIGLANGVVSNITGADAVAAGEFAKEKKDARAQKRAQSYDPVSRFEERCAALEKLKHQLRETFGGDKVNAIVVIDELDRCRPDYAVSYLETIKHVLNVHGMVFVLGVDEAQLKSATEVLFGQGVRFREYYRKFSHRTINLPQPAAGDVLRLGRNYLVRFLQKKGVRQTSLGDMPAIAAAIGYLCVDLGVNPRQAQEALRVAGHALGSTNDQLKSELWGYTQAFLFMSILRIGNEQMFTRLGSRSASVGEVVDAISLLKSHRPEWYGILMAGLRMGGEEWRNAFESGLNRLGMGPLNPDHYAYSWGDGDYYSLDAVYSRIEGVLDFEAHLEYSSPQ